MNEGNADRAERILAHVRANPGQGAYEIAHQLRLRDSARRPLAQSVERVLRKLEAGGLVVAKAGKIRTWHPAGPGAVADGQH